MNRLHGEVADGQPAPRRGVEEALVGWHVGEQGRVAGEVRVSSDVDVDDLVDEVLQPGLVGPFGEHAGELLTVDGGKEVRDVALQHPRGLRPPLCGAPCGTFGPVGGGSGAASGDAREGGGDPLRFEART